MAMKTLPSNATQVNRANKWGDTSRTYKLSTGEEYPSVTTILQAVGKPALVPWAAKQEREMVLQAAADLYEDLSPTAPKMIRAVFLSTLTARLSKVRAYLKELAVASEIGSQVHALIEWNLRRELEQTVGPEPKISDKGLWAFMVYEEWRKAHQFMPRQIEQVVYSRRHQYAGTMDWDGTVEAVFTVGDWKSGKAIYAEALLQNAAYVHALIEMGHATPPVQGCIVRLPKVETDPEPDVRLIPWDAVEAHFAAFLAVKELWSWLQTQKEEAPVSTPVPAKATPVDEEIALLLACLAAHQEGPTVLWGINKNFRVKATGPNGSTVLADLHFAVETKVLYRESLREAVDGLRPVVGR